MKDWWPFLTACGVLVAMLSFWAGAVTVTGVTPGSAPHGLIEYWFNRYQTVIAAFVAFSAALFVAQQIRETRAQHRANIRLAMRHEFDALQSAERFGESMIRITQDKRMDVASALMKVPASRSFPRIDPRRLDRIQQSSGDVVSAFVQNLLNEIASYEKWRDEGSQVTTDIFGGQTQTFEERIEKILEAAIHVVEVTKMRRKELEDFGA